MTAIKSADEPHILTHLPAPALEKVMRADPEVAAVLGQTCKTLREESKYVGKACQVSPYEHLALGRPQALGIALRQLPSSTRRDLARYCKQLLFKRCSYACMAQALGHSSQHVERLSAFFGAPCEGAHVGLRDVFDKPPRDWTDPQKKLQVFGELLARNRAPEVAVFLSRHQLDANACFPGSGLSLLASAIHPSQFSNAAVIEVLLAHGADVYGKSVGQKWWQHGLQQIDLSSPMARATTFGDWPALHTLLRAADRPPDRAMLDTMTQELTTGVGMVAQAMPGRWEAIAQHVQSASPPWIRLALLACAQCIAMQDALEIIAQVKANTLGHWVPNFPALPRRTDFADAQAYEDARNDYQLAMLSVQSQLQLREQQVQAII